MMLQYVLPMIVCIIVGYIGMFGYFRLFDENNQQTTDVVAIATAPPSVVASTQSAQSVPNIICVPTSFTIPIDERVDLRETSMQFGRTIQPP